MTFIVYVLSVIGLITSIYYASFFIGFLYDYFVNPRVDLDYANQTIQVVTSLLRAGRFKTAKEILENYDRSN